MTERFEPINDASRAARTKPRIPTGSNSFNRVTNVSLDSLPGIQCRGDDARHGEDKHRRKLQKRSEHRSPSGLRQVSRTQYALHVHLVHTPVKNASVERPGDNAPEGIVGVGVGLRNAHGGRHGGHQRVPSPDLMQSNEQHQTAAQDHDRRLNGIGVGNRGKSALDGNNRDDEPGQRHHRHHPPSQQPVQHQRSGIQVKSHFRHDANRQHQTGEKRPRRPVVTHFQELRNGEDLGANVVREHDRAGEAQADRGGQLDGARA